ncbi:HisI Phosphoribosyl-AMP cyclohydrolase [Candidatus Nanopelagicaceae bacterium]|jgi:phosphoribosyl-AMP cyclohydrolase
MSAIEFPAELANRLSDPSALIPAIAQDAATGEVLMLAYMNHAALTQTLSTKAATYWSRSRNELWVKGATSGHTQEVISVSLDCDSDAILIKVKQVGAACHTGDRTCFHTELISE